METRMRRTDRPIIRGSWKAALLLLLVSGFARGQIAESPSSPASQLTELLRRGYQMELERRWGEAMAYYEDAMRQFPEEPRLRRRFDFARLHHDVVRRFSDRSFRGLLARLPVNEALDVYGEVLLKVQAHHVDAPTCKELVERGANQLEIALSEPAFLEGCPAADAQALDAFRQELRRAIGLCLIQSRADACSAVAAAATLAQHRLGLPPVRVVLEFACGAANTLDSYSTYLTPDQLAEVYSQIEGNFVGLGVELKAHGQGLLVMRVIRRSPAERAGIRAGERIVAVEGRFTKDVPPEQAANLLQGPAGSTVQLTLADAQGQTRNVLVRRERVEVPSIEDTQILDRNQGVAYLRITCFQKTTPQDLDAALWGLYQQQMRSLIIDLRGNPGGLLVAAVEAADRFLERGVIVSTRGRHAQEDLTYSAHEAGTWRVPLVVLLDQDSASAAEIFAGAIRDHRRGTIVGSRSFGKGSVQGIFPLSSTGAGVRLTTARFYSPKGHPYNALGVQPDVQVHQVARPFSDPAAVSSPHPSADPVLATAVLVAQQVMAQR